MCFIISVFEQFWNKQKNPVTFLFKISHEVEVDDTLYKAFT